MINCDKKEKSVSNYIVGYYYYYSILFINLITFYQAISNSLSFRAPAGVSLGVSMDRWCRDKGMINRVLGRGGGFSPSPLSLQHGVRAFALTPFFIKAFIGPPLTYP